jgi:adenylosuccinate synthase
LEWGLRVPGTVILGAQWGDEGKGKITDLIADRMDLVVRFAGGNNAGHTVVCGNDEFKLHLIPSGILYPHITTVIGNGVVINPKVLLDEMDGLAGRGISCGKLRISCNAHLVMPYHLAFDRLGELNLGSAKLGTTHRGIGPAYADKADRMGMRVQDLLDEKIFRAKLEVSLERKNAILTKAFGQEPFDVDEILREYMGYAERLAPHIEDTSLLIFNALEDGQKVLFEGAQGTLLDLDHGTYPFVTSSSPTVGGAFTGTGVGPKHVDKVIGVAKAYVTRVGYGPFPTEQQNEVGDTMGEKGVEFGTTTGRKRRCGWLDLVLLRYAVRVNSLTGLALTKLDVLSAFDRLKVCVGYSFQGKIYHEWPPHQTIFHKCEPEYLELAGWSTDISEITERDDLPEEARRYVEFIEKAAGVPAEIISVGPKRSQTIVTREEYKGPIEEGPYLYREDFEPPC